MVAKMLRKTAVLLLALAVIQVPSEYIIPRFFEDMIKESGSPSIGARIVSGWEAVLGQHPHQAHVRIILPSGFSGGCGGSFVHPNWMVSAAHCTAPSVSLVISGGTVSLDRTPEYISETNEYYNYPTYDNSAPSRVQPNDISLVKLQQTLTFTRNLQPIRIQSSADANRNYADIVLQASGFGATWTGSAGSRELRWVYLRGITNALCRLTFGAALITDTTICAQWYNVTSQSTCQGDSGGPLVYTNDQGQRILIGATSFGAGPLFGGCHSGRPAAFIRPGHFHQWFTEVSGIDFQNLNDQFDGRQSWSLN